MWFAYSRSAPSWSFPIPDTPTATRTIHNPPANDGLVAQAPRGSHARRELRLRRIPLMVRESVLAGIAEPANERQAGLRGKRADRLAIEGDSESIFRLLQPGLVFVTKAEVEGQLRAHAQIVLNVRGRIVDVGVNGRRHRDRAGRRDIRAGMWRIRFPQSLWRRTDPAASIRGRS